MKKLCTAQDRFEAEIIVGKLKAAGLFVVAAFDDQGGARPMLHFAIGVPILIAESDYEEGLALLNS